MKLRKCWALGYAHLDPPLTAIFVIFVFNLGTIVLFACVILDFSIKLLMRILSTIFPQIYG